MASPWQPRTERGLWFCWVCRQPLQVVHGTSEDSTQYAVNGVWRDCHAECHEEYSDGMPQMTELAANIAAAPQLILDAPNG
jgi:hypothetical protein